MDTIDITTAATVSDPKVIDAVRSVMEAGVDTDFATEQAAAEYVLTVDLDPNGTDTDADLIAQGWVPATAEFNDDVRIALYQALRDGLFTVTEAAKAIGIPDWQLRGFDQTLVDDSLLTEAEVDAIAEAWEAMSEQE